MILRHQYGWALLLCNTTRRTRATDLNLRRLQSSHSSWLDGRDRKRLRQDLQQCTVNHWDSQSKNPNWTGLLVVSPERIISTGWSGMWRAPLKNPKYFLTEQIVTAGWLYKALLCYVGRSLLDSRLQSQEALNSLSCNSWPQGSAVMITGASFL